MAAGLHAVGPEEEVRRAFEQRGVDLEVVGQSFAEAGLRQVAVGRKESALVLEARMGSGLPERHMGWAQLDEEAAR